MSAGSDKASFTVGSNPGDIAPRIESLGNGSEFDFRNHSGRYTLLNFWAVYDAASRVRNVQLWNEVNKLDSERVTMYSVSLDENESVFAGTVKIDGLQGTNQFRDELGKKSMLYKNFALHKGLRNFLINDQGVIIASNVTPDQLTELLEHI